MRFWASWWTGNYEDEGCSTPPFKYWISGQRVRSEARSNDGERDDCSVCAVIDAASESAVEELVKKHFPDAEMRFCNPKPDDWRPGNRFQ